MYKPDLDLGVGLLEKRLEFKYLTRATYERPTKKVNNLRM